MSPHDVSRRTLLGAGVATAALATIGGLDTLFAAPAQAAPAWRHPFTFPAHVPISSSGDKNKSGHFGAEYTSGGSKRKYVHSGLDYSGPPSAGTDIYSVAAGVVSFVGWDSSWGNTVWIDHSDGYRSAYAHMQNGSTAVSLDQVIPVSTLVGKVGNTGGDSTGNHLHLVIRRYGAGVDPYYLVDHTVAPLAQPGVPAPVNQPGEDLIIYAPAATASTDGVIPPGVAFIQDGSNGGALRPLSNAEYSIYTYYKATMPYREALWDANAIRTVSKSAGVMQYTGTGNEIRLTGRIIYDSVATADFPPVRAAV